MKSIIQLKKVCYLCGASSPLHDHHLFNGTAYRKKSEEDGMKVWLCASCHRLVHENSDNLKLLKQIGQREREHYYGTRQQFIKRYGRNYLC